MRSLHFGGLANARTTRSQFEVRNGEAAMPARERVRSPEVQTRPVFSSSSRINCIRFRSFRLERSFAIER